MPSRLLFVDDEQDLEILIRQYFSMQIRKKEMEVFFALNGVEALEVIAAHPDLDMVVTDINMPTMDGLTLLKKIGEQYPLLRSVVVSAYGDTRNVRTAMNRGAFDFITKPISFEDLDITVNKTLNEVKHLKESALNRYALISVQQELEIGRQIQSSFLPKEIPQPEGWEIAARFRPAREVAGDFYDAFEMDRQGKMGFVIADVCDKGVGASLFMALIRSLMRAFSELNIIEGHDHNPVTLTNNYLIRNHIDSNMFATLFFGVFDPATGVLQYMNGGHNPPFIVNQDGIKTFLKPKFPAVGMMPDVDYQFSEVIMEPGDLLATFTDGVPEAKNEAGQFFSDHTLQSIVLADHSSAAGTAETLLNKLIEHIGEAKQYDDITMVIVKRKAP